jgi:hypothetical protein
MTGWAGPEHEPQRDEPLGLADSLAVILLPWLDPQAQTDPPCVKETEAQ